MSHNPALLCPAFEFVAFVAMRRDEWSERRKATSFQPKARKMDLHQSNKLVLAIFFFFPFFLPLFISWSRLEYLFSPHFYSAVTEENDLGCSNRYRRSGSTHSTRLGSLFSILTVFDRKKPSRPLRLCTRLVFRHRHQKKASSIFLFFSTPRFFPSPREKKQKKFPFNDK